MHPCSSQQYRTSGGAGVGGSYGPISSDADTRCKTALRADSSLKPQADAAPPGPQDQPQAASGQAQDPRPDSQAGDASGISRTSGGAGIGGSYGPAVTAEAAKRSAQQQGGAASDAQGPAASEAGAEQAQQRSKL
jgi:hypothetical protein